MKRSGFLWEGQSFRSLIVNRNLSDLRAEFTTSRVGQAALARRPAGGHVWPLAWECGFGECDNPSCAGRGAVELFIPLCPAAGAAISFVSHRSVARALRRCGI